jgi:hypothetical protein
MISIYRRSSFKVAPSLTRQGIYNLEPKTPGLYFKVKNGAHDDRHVAKAFQKSLCVESGQYLF